MAYRYPTSQARSSVHQLPWNGRYVCDRPSCRVQSSTTRGSTCFRRRDFATTCCKYFSIPSCSMVISFATTSASTTTWKRGLSPLSGNRLMTTAAGRPTRSFRKGARWRYLRRRSTARQERREGIGSAGLARCVTMKHTSATTAAQYGARASTKEGCVW
jgi:hypothetical protein